MAVKVDIIVDGLDEALKNLEGSAKERLEEADLLFKRAATVGVKHAKRNAPVDTGFMQQRIRSDGKRAPFLEGVMRSPAHYSAYVELGTYKSRAQPFMFPALEIAAAWLVDRLNGLAK